MLKKERYRGREGEGKKEKGGEAIYNYTMVVKFDHAIGGFINLL